MLTVYSENCTHKTKPYNGIIELLDALASRNIKISVLSNKADALTKKITYALFPNYFDDVEGLTVDTLKKPNPDKVLELIKISGLQPEEVMYVGDTGIDMQTAINADICGVGVLWGFREEDELDANGAKHVLSHPLDLIAVL